MVSLLQDAIQDYYDVRTANATDLTVAQVKTLNWLESEGGVLTVERTATGTVAFVHEDYEEISGRLFGYRYGVVLSDGKIKWYSI